MAIELITKIWCDGHLNGDGTQIEASTIPVIVPNGKTHELDLCENCQRTIPYLTLVDMAVEWGRAVEPKTRKSRASVGKEADVECLFCDFKSPSQQGSKMHMRRSHREQYEAYLAEQEESSGDIVEGEFDTETAMLICPEEGCNRSFGNRGAMGRHLKTHAVAV